MSESPVTFMEQMRTTRQWTPIDNYNTEFIEQLQVRDASKEMHDYITENMVRILLRFDSFHSYHKLLIK